MFRKLYQARDIAKKGETKERKASGTTEIYHDNERTAPLLAQTVRARAMGFGDKATMAHLEEWNDEHCDPPVPSSKLDGLVRGIPERDGELPMTPKEMALNLCRVNTETPIPRRSGLVRNIHRNRIETTFIVPGMIPLRQLTMWTGHGEVGKTYVLTAIVAAITNGTMQTLFPGSCLTEPRFVYFLSGEDDEDSTLLERLELHNTVLDNIRVINKRFRFDQVAQLKTDIKVDKPVLIIFDSTSTFLSPTIDMNTQVAVVSDLDQLVEIAREYNLAVGVIHHLRKGDSGDLVEQMIASVGFSTLARTCVGVYYKSGDKGPRIAKVIKGNLVRDKMGFEFDINDGICSIGPIQSSNVAGHTRTSQREKCRAFLKSYLPQAPREIPTSEFNKAAVANGFTARYAWDVAHDDFGMTTKDGETGWVKINGMAGIVEKVVSPTSVII